MSDPAAPLLFIVPPELATKLRDAAEHVITTYAVMKGLRVGAGRFTQAIYRLSEVLVEIDNAEDEEPSA